MSNEPLLELLSWIGLVITNGCNFRCGMCDYWKTKRPINLTSAQLLPLVKVLKPLGLDGVTITGGEPLGNSEWYSIAKLFSPIARVNLSTNGSLIRRNLSRIAETVDKVIVSIDGASAPTFHRIRGVNMLADLWRSMETLKQRAPHVKVCVKMTIQKHNVFETREFLEQALERDWIDGVGYAIPDLSMMAFELSRRQRAEYEENVIPNRADLPRIRTLFETLMSDYASLYDSRYIFEGDLNRYVTRFESLYGMSPNPPLRRCLIPSQVLTVHPDARVSGCYFQPADSSLESLTDSDGAAIRRLLHSRKKFQSQKNVICRTCDQLLFTNSRFEVVTRDASQRQQRDWEHA